MDVAPPVPAAGQVVVDVAPGRASAAPTSSCSPARWPTCTRATRRTRCGSGTSGAGSCRRSGPASTAAWLGRRVTGDTMIGCGHCERCAAGRHHVCAHRREVGIRGGCPAPWPSSWPCRRSPCIALPDDVDDTAGALVEPGGNALRAVLARRAGTGDRVLVLGTGTIGLLVADVRRGRRAPRSTWPARTSAPSALARTARLRRRLAGRPTCRRCPGTRSSTRPTRRALPALALDLVEPGGRVVYIGLAGSPSLVDTRTLALKDVTAVGILGGSPGLAGTIERYAAGDVDPRPLVAATVGLERGRGRLGRVAARRMPGRARRSTSTHADNGSRGEAAG